MKDFLALLFSTLILLNISVCITTNAQISTQTISPNKGVVAVKDRYTITLVLQKSIPINTNIKIKTPRGLEDLQKTNSALDGYISATTSSTTAKVSTISVQNAYNDEPLPIWDNDVRNKIITLGIKQNRMQAGDTIWVYLGGLTARSETRPHAITTNTNVEVAYDTSNNGRYLLQNDKPTINFLPDEADTLQIISKSILSSGQNSIAYISALDKHENVSIGFEGTVSIQTNAIHHNLPAFIHFSAADSGIIEVPFYISDTGIFYIKGKVSNDANAIRGATTIFNPIMVTKNEDKRIFWGDFHTHGEQSRDGMGSNYHRYAKKVAGLDFFSITDHADNILDTFGLNNMEWSWQRQAAVQYNKPGEFVTFLGYENSFDNPSGHYNCIFNFKDADIALVPNLPKRLYKDILKIWDALDTMSSSIESITIPHHTGKIFNIFTDVNSGSAFSGQYYNSKYKNCIEIMSWQGQSELYNPLSPLSYENLRPTSGSAKGPYYAQDAWVLGEKLGVMASGDNHYAQCGRHMEGITAVVADSLERNTIFQAFKNRHTYATTGERIIVDFKINNAIMGDDIYLHPDSAMHLAVKVIGTDTIEKVEVLKWDFVNHNYSSLGNPIYDVVHTETPNSIISNIKAHNISHDNNSLFYIRVTQKNRLAPGTSLAWTSPIWVYSIDSNILSLDATPLERAAQIDWQVILQNKAKEYHIQKSNNNTTYTEIATTNPAAFKDSLQYRYIDNLPYNKLNYYRVMLTLQNGINIYSNYDTVYFILDSLTALTHQLLGNNATLQWAVINELYADKYIIENSLDKLHFYALDSLASHKYNISHTSYNFGISDISNYSNKPYFRVKQILQNNEYYYSSIDSLQQINTGILEYTKGIDVYFPHPFVYELDGMECIINTDIAKELDIHIFDSQGKLIDNFEYQTMMGKNTIILPTHYLPAGIYYLAIYNGNAIHTKSFVISQHNCAHH